VYEIRNPGFKIPERCRAILPRKSVNETRVNIWPLIWRGDYTTWRENGISPLRGLIIHGVSRDEEKKKSAAPF